MCLYLQEHSGLTDGCTTKYSEVSIRHRLQRFQPQQIHLHHSTSIYGLWHTLQKRMHKDYETKYQEDFSETVFPRNGQRNSFYYFWENKEDLNNTILVNILMWGKFFYGFYA